VSRYLASLSGRAGAEGLLDLMEGEKDFLSLFFCLFLPGWRRCWWCRCLIAHVREVVRVSRYLASLSGRAGAEGLLDLMEGEKDFLSIFFRHFLPGWRRCWWCRCLIAHVREVGGCPDNLQACREEQVRRVYLT